MSLYGNSIIDYRNTQVVNEAYVGKTPTLEEIEKKIGELRENIKFSDNLNRSDKITEINRLFEKQFGMDIFALKVLQTKYIDAYTYEPMYNLFKDFKILNKVRKAEKLWKLTNEEYLKMLLNI